MLLRRGGCRALGADVQRSPTLPPTLAVHLVAPLRHVQSRARRGAAERVAAAARAASARAGRRRAQVNCRRAAAAAFQEAVGRLGGLPHGIDVVAAADFFALAGRPQAFLAVGPAVAAFPEYRGALAEHLARRQARAARPGVGLGRLLGLGWVRC